MPLVLIHTGIVKYLSQILILYSIQFAYPTYSGSPFSDEIAIMIRHYVIRPYLKIRHFVIHPTNLYSSVVAYAYGVKYTEIQINPRKFDWSKKVGQGLLSTV